jgi:hypothetical protein
MPGKKQKIPVKRHGFEFQCSYLDSHIHFPSLKCNTLQFLDMKIKKFWKCGMGLNPGIILWSYCTFSMP